MTAKAASRYDLKNLPISEDTRKGLTKENIQYIGAVGRMLSLQDDVYEEQFDKVIQAIKDQSAQFNKRFDAIEARLTAIEAGASDRERRIEYLEKRASLPYMVLRYGIVICIGIGLGWLLHSIF